ncbi:cytochrome P450 [Mollisia scopiformis]|uniref:Cytochrome P450 n=1 Tax=Mollisia scopiformis TaxID=149040 RepID=A0A194WUI1_MOLSC|nr:cytochrome P450 [Mollisia scopiformis]KUJ11615.1 cytochrome P450 [Mollisia scopiformis]
MSENNYLPLIVSNLPWLLLAFTAFKALSLKYKSGLSKLPGPQLAAFTDLWRFFVAWGRRPEVAHQELHAKYGDAVRMGPNMVSISDYKAVKEVYGFNIAYIKSDFYPVQRAIANGKALESLFNTTDNKFHAKIRRAISSTYATSTIVQFEPLVDSTISTFLDQLDERYVGKDGDAGICDFSIWLHYFAFDVIGELLFKQRIGFLEGGTDVEGIISNVGKIMSYISLIGQMPWLDHVLMKNPIRIWMSARGIGQKASPMATFAAKRIAERLAMKDSATIPEDKATLPPDILDRFLLLKEKDPVFFNDTWVLSLMVGNVFGGSDSTAITMRTIFYHLLKSPHTMDALMEELSEVKFSRDDGIATWNETRQLPYLTAVLQEALRLHPAAGFHLERIVPASGLQVGQHFLPAGTIVGASAWVLHQKESMFGPKCQEFRPERWIEASEQRRTEMNNAMFAFSMGSKECLGKGIAFLETYKLIPTILRKYELSLVDPKAEWKLENAFFVNQTDFYIRIQRRHEVKV